MSFSLYKKLYSRSGSSFTGPGGTALDTSLVNISDTLQARGYDVKEWGAVGNGLANDTTAVQNAINQAHTDGGGIVFLPQGTYLCDPLTGYRDVSIIGVGQPRYATTDNAGSSRLLLNSSGTLLTISYTAGSFNNQAALYAGFELNGNGKATSIGCDLENVYLGTWERVGFNNCTSIGLKMRNVEVTKFSQCMFEGNVTGIDADSSGGAQSNLNEFDRCQFHGNTTYAVALANLSHLTFNGCNFDGNGTTGSSTTGCIKISGANPNGEGVGLVVNQCWFEMNWGHSCIRVNTATNAQGFAAIVRDTLCTAAPGSGTKPTYGIYIEGGGGTTTTVYMDGCSIDTTGVTTPVLINGATGKLYQGANSAAATNTSGTLINWQT